MQRWQISPYLHLCWFAKVTDFLPFCTFVITNNCHPLLLFPTYSPQAYSLLEHPTQTEKILHSLFPKLFFFHWARGTLSAGATLLGWPNSGVDGQSNKEKRTRKRAKDIDSYTRSNRSQLLCGPVANCKSFVIPNKWIYVSPYWFSAAPW